MCQASTCGRVLGRGSRASVQVLQNRGSQMVVLRFITLSAQDCHWWNPREKKLYTHVIVLAGSVPHKMAEVLQSVSAQLWNWTQVARLTATHLNHQAIGSYQFNNKKQYMSRRISPPATNVSFATDLTANFGCDLLIITPDIVSKLLRASIWSRCAFRLKSEQTPFPHTGATGRRFRPAALHMIWLGTCCFVPISYFCSETNDW